MIPVILIAVRGSLGWMRYVGLLPFPSPACPTHLHLPSINNSTDHKLTRLLPKLTQTSAQSYAMKTKPFEISGEKCWVLNS